MLRSTSRRVALMVAAVLAAATVGWQTAVPAEASDLTQGLGRFPSITWLTWGADGTDLPNGSTATSTTNVGASTLTVRCTMSDLNGRVHAYRSGDWVGDGFDDLYHLGGTGTQNQLVAAIANSQAGTSPTFNVSCGADLDGIRVPLAGLVMADAESSAGSEYVGATISPSASWRIIDRIRGAACPNDTYAFRHADGSGNRLELHGPSSGSCEQDSSQQPEPSAVAFMDGASSATNVTIAGGGYSAVALGVMLTSVDGTAPGSYGDASALTDTSFTGGDVPATAGSWSPTNRGVPVFESVNLANATTPTSGFTDSPFGAAKLAVTPGTSYTGAAFSCTGSGQVAGWIDWNGNGVFDSGEKSDVQPCGPAVRLTWQVPSGTLSAGGSSTTWARIRLVGPTDSVSATGLSSSGDVADQQLTIVAPPRLTLSTHLTKVSADDQVSTRADIGPGVVTAGSAPVVSQGLSAASPSSLEDYDSSLTCTDTANGSASVAVTGSAGSWQLPALRAGQVVACDVTTVPRPWTGLSVVASAAKPVDVNGSGVIDARDTIARTFTVTNTGNRPASNVAVSTTPGAVVACPSSSLAAGQSTTCSAATPYVITSADVAAGFASVRATATATSNGSSVASAPVTSATPVDQGAAALAVQQIQGGVVDANHNGALDAGDKLTYFYLVSNPGPVTVNGAAVTSDWARGSAMTCLPSTLRPGGMAECGSRTHTITSAEARTGSLTSAADVTGTSVSGLEVKARGSQVVALGRRAPGLRVNAGVLKVSDANADGLVDAGDKVVYAFSVRNASSAAVSSPVVSAPTLSAKPIGCGTGSLKAGASRTCPAFTHTVTSAEVAVGRIQPVVTAAATSTAAGRLKLTSPAVDVMTVTTAPSARLTVAAAASATGSSVRWTYRVTNAGNTAVSAVAVTGSVSGSSVTCGGGALAAGASRTCTSAGHLVTSAELAAGTLTQKAVASGRSASGSTVTSTPAMTSLPVRSTGAGLRVVQQTNATDVDDDGLIDAGDTITYSLKVVNTGDAGVSALSLTAAGLSSSPLPCDRPWVGAGRTVQCGTVVRVVSAADLKAGIVTSRVVATGTAGGAAVSSGPEQSVVATTAPRGALSVVQSASVSGGAIRYAFQVTNAGNVPLTSLAVADGVARTVTCASTSLAPGASTSCHSSVQYPTTYDTAAGFVSHTASLTADLPGGAATTPVTSTVVVGLSYE